MERGQRRAPQQPYRGQSQRQQQRRPVQSGRPSRPGPYKRRRRRSKKPIILAAVLLAILLIVILTLSLGGKSDKSKTAVEIVTAMSSQIPTMSEIVDYTRETDPNGALGSPGWYVNKTDWVDSRAAGTYTLEVYTDEKKAVERTEYLETFYGSILADYVVYRIDGYVFRVSNKLSPDDISVYVKLLESQIE